MKKIFCDFCKEEIKHPDANNWFKISIRSANGIPDDNVQYDCCCNDDICYDCAKEVCLVITTMKSEIKLIMDMMKFVKR